MDNIDFDIFKNTISQIQQEILNSNILLMIELENYNQYLRLYGTKNIDDSMFRPTLGLIRYFKQNFAVQLPYNDEFILTIEKYNIKEEVGIISFYRLDRYVVKISSNSSPKNVDILFDVYYKLRNIKDSTEDILSNNIASTFMDHVCNIHVEYFKKGEWLDYLKERFHKNLSQLISSRFTDFGENQYNELRIKTLVSEITNG